MTTHHRQLKQSEIPNARKQLSLRQRYECPVCKSSIAHGMVALDHCHKTGHVRATLCGLCNRNEGKVMKAVRYMAPKGHPVWEDPVGWLRSLADYLEYHSKNPSGLIHPSFDLATGKQKPIKRPKKK